MPERWRQELEKYRRIGPPASLGERIWEDIGRPRPERASGRRREGSHRVSAAAVAILIAAASTTFLVRSLGMWLQRQPVQRQPIAEGTATNGKIAFVSDGGIWLVNPDGTGLTEVRAGDLRNYDTQPMWSPDGTKLAFLHRAEGRFELLVYDVASGLISRIAGRGFDVDSPAWSPDGQRIAFVSGNDLFISMTDGVEPIRLTKGAFPAWSPDGSRIAFERGGSVWVIGADGAHETALAPGALPAWSPDGAKLAFIDDGLQLSVMNQDGTGLTRLTDARFDDIGPPMWSPDGSRIVFDALRGGNYDIYLANADGSGVTDLTGDPGDENVPTWSPDGTKIAFIAGEAVTGNPGAASTFELFVMDVDGTDRARLTTGAAPRYALSWQRLQS